MKVTVFYDVHVRLLYTISRLVTIDGCLFLRNIAMTDGEESRLILSGSRLRESPHMWSGRFTTAVTVYTLVSVRRRTLK